MTAAKCLILLLLLFGCSHQTGPGVVVAKKHTHIPAESSQFRYGLRHAEGIPLGGSGNSGMGPSFGPIISYARAEQNYYRIYVRFDTGNEGSISASRETFNKFQVGDRILIK